MKNRIAQQSYRRCSRLRSITNTDWSLGKKLKARLEGLEQSAGPPSTLLKQSHNKAFKAPEMSHASRVPHRLSQLNVFPISATSSVASEPSLIVTDSSGPSESAHWNSRRPQTDLGNTTDPLILGDSGKAEYFVEADNTATGLLSGWQSVVSPCTVR